MTLCSKVTARAQTTLPSGVRRALGIQAGDQLEYVIRGEEAVIRKAGAQGEDPAMGAFLAFLVRDIETRPDRLTSFPTALREEIQRLIYRVGIDHDEPLDDAVEL